MTNKREHLDKFLGSVGFYQLAQKPAEGLNASDAEGKTKARASALKFLRAPRDQGGEGIALDPAISDERLRDELYGVYYERKSVAQTNFTNNLEAILTELPEENLELLAHAVPVSKKLPKNYEALAKAEKPILAINEGLRTYTSGKATLEQEHLFKETLSKQGESLMKQALKEQNIAKEFVDVILMRERQQVYQLAREGVQQYATEQAQRYEALFMDLAKKEKVSLRDYASAKLLAHATDKPGEAMDLVASIATYEKQEEKK